jgi:hypothetical protein
MHAGGGWGIGVSVRQAGGEWWAHGSGAAVAARVVAAQI